MHLSQCVLSRENKLFWTDYTADSVHQANLDGTNPTDIVSNVNRPSESLL